MRIVYENQNKHYAINVFVFTRLGKGRGNPNWFPFGHVPFIMETSQVFVTAF